MKTHAQKPAAPQPKVPLQHDQPARQFAGKEARPVESSADAEGRRASPGVAAPARFAHDFSRIPLHAPAPITIQPKLELNTPGDRHEQEAERVANQIMRVPEARVSAAPPRIPRMPREDDDRQAGKTLRAQASPAATESEPSPATEAAVRSLESSGEPLPATLRAFYEPRFGHGFGQVRIHTDAAAAASSKDLNALAYTRGRHIVFAPGRFEPHTERGQRLLAHELTHVVQQGWAGPERIQRSYVAPTPDAIATRKLPKPDVIITDQEDETEKIQRAPDPQAPTPTPTPDPTTDPATDPPPAPALASPTLTLNPGGTIVRGDTVTASVVFSPTAGEKLKVTDWRYTTAGGDVVTRPNTDAKFQSEWQGVMALSGNLELSYTVKPTGKPAVAGTAVTSAVTVNDRTGPAWQTTVTDGAETPLTGAPSPPEKAEQLGDHEVPQGTQPAAGEAPISSGPNAGFTYVSSVDDRDYKSDPHIHPDVTNAASAFRVFHQAAGLLYVVTNAGVRTLVPSTEYTGLKVGGGTITFNVSDWTAFFKKYRIYTVTVSGGGNTATAQDGWWVLEPNTEAGAVKIVNDGAVRAALQIGARTSYSTNVTVNGGWQALALMPSASIPAATRSHEYTHATHSHRANFHKIVRALDPRRVLERTVSTPSNPVTFRDKIQGLLTEIKKPNHEIVDEAASKAAGSFVAVSGQTMAAVNQNPAGGASLGALWDLTHDKQLE